MCRFSIQETLQKLSIWNFLLFFYTGELTRTEKHFLARVKNLTNKSNEMKIEFRKKLDRHGFVGDFFVSAMEIKRPLTTAKQWFGLTNCFSKKQLSFKWWVVLYLREKTIINWQYLFLEETNDTSKKWLYVRQRIKNVGGDNDKRICFLQPLFGR